MQNKKRKIKEIIKSNGFRKAAIATGVSLALIGSGIGIGYGIFGRRCEETIPVKPMSELVSTFYYPKTIQVTSGGNIYGAKENIIHVIATDGKDEIAFSIYESDPERFSKLLEGFDSIRKYNGTFKLIDPIYRNSGYPKDYRASLDLRTERSAEGKPVYILEGDDILFYPVYKQER
mgnify:CR=1 FL=1